MSQTTIKIIKTIAWLNILACSVFFFGAFADHEYLRAGLFAVNLVVTFMSLNGFAQTQRYMDSHEKTMAAMRETEVLILKATGANWTKH